MSSVTVSFRSKTQDIKISPQASVAELKASIARAFRLAAPRQGLKILHSGGTVLRLDDDRATVETFLNRVTDPNERVVVVKDLGPQFSYRGVFIIEYLGPILIVALCATRPSFLYSTPSNPSPLPTLPIFLWLGHFLKRELETLFVHRFSRPTMPLFNLFKNSAYYWAFALAVGYFLCAPTYTLPEGSLSNLGVSIMVISELINFMVHMQLRMMRPAEGSTKRAAPSGPLFALVWCPNYTSEVLGWVGFSLLTGLAASWIFTLVGLLQMTQWALDKKRGYIKRDPANARLGRKAIIPFVV